MSDGPSDPLTSIITFTISQIWKASVLAVLVFLITLLVTPRQWLAMTANNDRTIQRIEAFPCSLAPWGLAACTAGPPPPAPVELQRGDARDPAGRALSTAATFFERFVPRMVDKLGTYWAIIQPRIWIILGLLPMIIALFYTMWGVGAAINAIKLRNGDRLSPQYFTWGMTGFGICVMVIVAYAVIPAPLPAITLLLPILGGMFAITVTRAQKA